MTVGIVGGGQLARMMALAGYPLGLDFLVLDKDGRTPAAQVSPSLCGEFTDPALLDELARRSEVVTFDWENVPAPALERIESQVRIAPPRAALAVAQDRLSEKQLFGELRIPTNRHATVDSLADLERAVASLGLPGVLKTRRLGYDGKGQRVLRHRRDVAAAWEALGAAPLLYEEFVPFDYEVSIIGVRGADNAMRTWPLNRNLHRDGVLALTRAPWRAPALEKSAVRHVKRVLAHFDYRGVLTIEFFVRNGALVANEMAPRVHNSGHWTIEGAETSQFENHVRAILGLPLGNTAARGHCAMVNLLGQIPDRSRLLGEPGLHFHDYGKEPRPGRKVGHVTLVEKTASARDRRATSLLRRIHSRKMAR